MQSRSCVTWLGLLTLLFTVPVGRADLVFLKDGHVLQGTVRREVTAEYDPISHETIQIPKGFFLLDDGARRIYFSPSQVRIVEKLPPPAEERVLSHAGRYVGNPRFPPQHLEVMEVGKWDLKRWERNYTYRSPEAPRVSMIQGLGSLSPYYARVDAVTRFRWSATYLTREWEPETVLELLRASPSLQPKKEDAPPQLLAKRLRTCDFLAQAGWYDHAAKELDRVEKDFPDQKERVASARSMLNKLKLRDEWELIKNWYQAGRFAGVRERLSAFPLDKVSDRVQVDVGEMKARLRQSADLVEQATRALDDTVKDVATTKGQALASAVAVLRGELHPANVDRLDAFLGQYKDAERQKARGQKSKMDTEQLLSLAISGWLLGSPSAESLPDHAINLWKSRQMVLQYLQETESGGRRRILADYEKTVTPRVDLDEIAQMIEGLPPVEPARSLTTATTPMQAGTQRQPTTYNVKLPPEYSHNRAYPLLIVLHTSNEKADKMIDRFAKHAADHGYVLAAPQWDRGLGDEYRYSEREHDAVLDTLADLKRRFRIDCDRVFLFGYAEGGKMAFDVGLSHPDLFAGVMPMAAGPSAYPRRYWRNAQYLPVYAVNGTRGSDSYNTLREQFNNWVLRGYPALWVEYKGRGTEFFSGEVPFLFDWMRHQRRTFPLHQLGTDGNGTNFGTEFCTLRPEDNRFYWLSTANISSRNQVPPARFSNLVQPATLTGRIEPTTNEIVLKTQGLNDVTVWLGRNVSGQYMVDMDKPVNVRVGLKTYVANRKVVPSLAVLLEDLARRGDRKQLYVAKVEVNLRQ